MNTKKIDQGIASLITRGLVRTIWIDGVEHVQLTPQGVKWVENLNKKLN